MAKLTRREYFDLLVKTSKEGKFPSIGKDSCGDATCWYRDSKGCACAIGIIIPDNMYNKEMEGMTFDALVKDYPEINDVLPENMTNRELFRCQTIHDSQGFDINAHVKKKWNHEKFVQDLKERVFTEIK